MSDQNAPTEQQLTDALRAAPPIILAPGPREAPSQIPPVPHDVWDLPGGTAWVYYAEGQSRLTKPVIVADGFNSGPTDVGLLWEGLDWRAYPFFSELRSQGRDLVIVGFQERSASILENARAVMDAIQRAQAGRQGEHPLAVGGFSMGGLVTRYALAKMEHDRMHHGTELYFSYDSPHRGAWIPIALQAFAHYIRKLNPKFSAQMNSAAAQQLLWQHIAEWQDPHGTSKERDEFLAELQRVGWWPQGPRKIGVANGPATGAGNGIRPAYPALTGRGISITGTELLTQSTGDDTVVGQLRVLTQQKEEILTSGLPDIDGAPGGTLEGFGILADVLNKIPGMGVHVPIREHCFVPTVSAVAIRDIDTNEALYTDINSLDPADSELDAFLCASPDADHGHTVMTQELGAWILEQLP